MPEKSQVSGIAPSECSLGGRYVGFFVQVMLPHHSDQISVRKAKKAFVGHPNEHSIDTDGVEI